jgi:hypothetical protein
MSLFNSPVMMPALWMISYWYKNAPLNGKFTPNKKA